MRVFSIDIHQHFRVVIRDESAEWPVFTFEKRGGKRGNIISQWGDAESFHGPEGYARAHAALRSASQMWGASRASAVRQVETMGRMSGGRERSAQSGTRTK